MTRKRVLLTLVQLFVASLVVGLVLATLGVGWGNLVAWLGEQAGEAVELVRGFFLWAWPYVRLGAAVVIPVWLVVMAFRLVRRRG